MQKVNQKFKKLMDSGTWTVRRWRDVMCHLVGL